jgi:hypothetical protein
LWTDQRSRADSNSAIGNKWQLSEFISSAAVLIAPAQKRLWRFKRGRRSRFFSPEMPVFVTEASIPLDAVRRPRDTPIWKLEAALKCRSCRTPRYSPRVHMVKLTEARQTTPYKWVHPDEDR